MGTTQRRIETVGITPLARDGALGKIFEILLKMSKTDKAIDIAKMISYNSYVREDAFGKIYEALLKTGSTDKAIEVATIISLDACRKNNLLGRISQALLRLCTFL